ncbi:MAG: bifunctional DNA-formamidopyrimidine glycosylase/DNA-(apurinic or apyrimidinic site) lyase [Succinivibrio sp.]
MPELPEVEVTKRGIEKYLTGRTISRIFFDDKSLRIPFSKELYNLEGAEISSVDRRAKYIVLTTTQGYLLIHLGMTGHLMVLQEDSKMGIHDHFEITTDHNIHIRMNDIRRFGLVKYYPLASSPYESEPLKSLGPEPFSDEFNKEYLFAVLKGRKKNIKQCLMDNSIVVGVGNIYASEILFECRINPSRKSCDVNLDECEQIIIHTRKILKDSISRGGTTIRDFSGADGKLGYFVQELAVYGKDREPCKICGTPIEKTVHGQRTTYYCPLCQKN